MNRRCGIVATLTQSWVSRSKSVFVYCTNASIADLEHSNCNGLWRTPFKVLSGENYVFIVSSSWCWWFQVWQGKLRASVGILLLCSSSLQYSPHRQEAQHQLLEGQLRESFRIKGRLSIKKCIIGNWQHGSLQSIFAWLILAPMYI